MGKLYTLSLFIFFSSLQISKAQNKKVSDSIWLKIGNRTYYSLGHKPKDSVHPSRVNEMCFFLLKKPNTKKTRDSLELYILENPNRAESLKTKMDSLNSSIKEESKLDTILCFNQINRLYQTPIVYKNYKSLNIAYRYNLSELNKGKINKVREKWETKNHFGILINQNSFKDWNSGGENSVSSIFRMRFERNYRFEFVLWESDLRFGIGFNQEQDQDIRKTEDLFEFNSTYGYRTGTNSNWYYSANIEFRTQFFKGYNYPNIEQEISRFMAPAYLLVGIGSAYSSEDNKTKIYLSPFTNKATFVLDQNLANIGAFGVTPAKLDDQGNIISRGKRNRTEIGSLIRAKNELEVIKNIRMTNELSLYSDYINKFGNIDVNWNLRIDFIVNKYVKANFGLSMIYDDDIDTFDTNDEGITINKGPKLQIKQLVGLGLVYDF
jgi:hypothetical protein